MQFCICKRYIGSIGYLFLAVPKYLLEEEKFILGSFQKFILGSFNLEEEKFILGLFQRFSSWSATPFL